MTDQERLELVCAYAADPTGWDEYMSEWARSVARGFLAELDRERADSTTTAHAAEEEVPHVDCRHSRGVPAHHPARRHRVPARRLDGGRRAGLLVTP